MGYIIIGISLITIVIIVGIAETLERKQCPFCKESIDKKAIKCPHCQSILEEGK